MRANAELKSCWASNLLQRGKVAKQPFAFFAEKVCWAFLFYQRKKVIERAFWEKRIQLTCCAELSIQVAKAWNFQTAAPGFRVPVSRQIIHSHQSLCQTFICNLKGRSVSITSVFQASRLVFVRIKASCPETGLFCNTHMCTNTSMWPEIQQT